MKNKKYFIGLDIGTNTVGWAVIDEDYNVLRFKGKHMWGTRLIDDVETAQKRRAQRSARRHYERRRQRVELLQELIGPMVLEVDQNFFMRLNTSFLKHESEDAEFGKSNLHILFDGKFTDVDYYKKYPTIYHLRKAMIEEDRKFDPREIYLALHHLVKYRGNFLYEGDVANIGDIKDAVADFFETLSANFGDEINPFVTKIDEIVNILTNKDIPRYISKKKRATIEDGNVVEPILTKDEKIADLFDDKTQKEIAQEFAKAVVGYSFSLSKVLRLDSAEKPEKDKVSFKNDFETDRDKIYESVNQSDALKQLEVCYNTYIFGDILSGEQYICNAMVKKYEKHKDDLEVLKDLVKMMDKDANVRDENGVLKRKLRRKMFYENGGKAVANYAAYVANQQTVKHNGKNRYAKVKQDEFYKFVEKFVENAPDCQEKEYVLLGIEKGTFMPKLNDVANGAVPHQFNLKELKIILQKQGEYYPILKENAEKIISILTFRRPFYVGVLSETSPIAWSKGLYPTDKKLYPWNFMQEIDKDGLAEAFINKLTGKCVYFKDEQVMPKQSITYQAYACLNELNKIKIKGKKICPELKKWVFDNVMCKVATLKVKRLVEELKKYDAVLYKNLTEDDIEGLSEGDKFANGMTTLSWFRGVFKDGFDIKNIGLYDKIVRINTVFSDKDIRKKRIAECADFTDNPKRLDTLCKKDFVGWGRYSHKFLNEIRDANNLTVLEELYKGWYYSSKGKVCYNVNELIYDEKLGFSAQLLAQTEGAIDKFEFDKHIKDLYCSPKDKSIIWQTICIVEEIVKIMGCPPHDIYIETTREDAEKKKTSSRYKNLKALYEGLKKDKSDFYATEVNPAAIAQMDKLKALDDKAQNSKLDDDKLYLYLLQLGRCMYSGEELDIDQFAQYEIDHIIPRTYIKDDSFSNRVLVKRIENQRKSDLALKNEVIGKQIDFWRMLLEHKFITKKKFNSLIRGEFSDKDIDGFINRQLVETSQIVKITMNLLSRKYGTHDENDASRIKGVKASLTSQFRKSQMDQYVGFAKIRSLNDMHHAKDAYLAAVLGHFTTHTYPCWGNDKEAWKIRQDIQKLATDAKDGTHEFRNLINRRNNIILETLIYKGIDDEVDPSTGEIVKSKIENIRKNMARNDCIVTKKIDERANPRFYKDTRISAAESTPKGVSLRFVKNKNGEMKPLPTALYGSFTSEFAEYFAIIRHQVVDKTKKVKKGENRPMKFEYKFVNIPVMVAYMQRQDDNAVGKYLSEIGYPDAELVKKVYSNQVITIGEKDKQVEQLLYIVSDSEMNNATQFFVNAKYEKLLYTAEHFVTLINSVTGKTIANKIKLAIVPKWLCLEIEKLENQQDIIGEFIKYFVDKVKQNYPLYKTLASKIEDYYFSKGANLSFKEKLVFINEILNMTSAAKKVANLNEYGLPSNAGRVYNKTIDCGKTKWIHQSVTGLFTTILTFDDIIKKYEKDKEKAIAKNKA